MGVAIRMRIIGYDNYANGVHNAWCATRKLQIDVVAWYGCKIQEDIGVEKIQQVQEAGQEEYQEGILHNLQNGYGVIMGNGCLGRRLRIVIKTVVIW
jgi:hypothetical protein